MFVMVGYNGKRAKEVCMGVYVNRRTGMTSGTIGGWLVSGWFSPRHKRYRATHPAEWAEDTVLYADTMDELQRQIAAYEALTKKGS